MINHDAKEMLNDFIFCDKFDVIEQLSQIDVATLTIVGAKEQIIPIRIRICSFSENYQ